MIIDDKNFLFQLVKSFKRNEFIQVAKFDLILYKFR